MLKWPVKRLTHLTHSKNNGIKECSNIKWKKKYSETNLLSKNNAKLKKRPRRKLKLKHSLKPWQQKLNKRKSWMKWLKPKCRTNRWPRTLSNKLIPRLVAARELLRFTPISSNSKTITLNRICKYNNSHSNNIDKKTSTYTRRPVISRVTYYNSSKHLRTTTITITTTVTTMNSNTHLLLNRICSINNINNNLHLWWWWIRLLQHSKYSLNKLKRCLQR